MGRKGFTLLELVIVLAISGILTGGIVTIGYQVVRKEREDKTIEHLKRLKAAVIGDPLTVHQEVRTSFGYFGDMGALPATLEDLYVKDTQPSFAFLQNLNTGAGWDGPYLDPEMIEYFNSLKQDYFGQNLSYTTTGLPAGVQGRIRSLGRDGEDATADDLSVEFSTNELYSRVSGFVRDADDNGVSGLTVAVNYPNNGTLTSANVQTDAYGFYNFNNVPYGNHSLSLSPRLFLAAGTGQISGPYGNNVTFVVLNTSTSAINISSLRVDYAINPATDYGSISISQPNNVQYDLTLNPRKGNGDTIIFPSPLPVAGATSDPAVAVAICVQSPITSVPDVSLASLKRGWATEITLQDFRDQTTGAEINMTGVVFAVTFSDGSVVTFVP